ncbi:MAG: amidase [Ruminococcus sp.]|nr:amidase [Ruminococcus sp.]
MTITKKLLTVNQYSRPGIKRGSTTKIAVHYVANPGSTAIANRNYFENCKTTHTYVSSNYIVGLEGEVIRCVPDDEIAYCTNSANSYSISIETCHPDSTGKFNTATYSSLVELCAQLLSKYNLTSNDLIRHFDVTGKICPKSFVPEKGGGTDDNSSTAWNKFKSDVKAKMSGTASGSASSGASTSSGSFLVKVICDVLNIRNGAGTSYKINGTVKKNEVFTIVETKMNGSVEWGKLKSGAGWISLGS